MLRRLLRRWVRPSSPSHAAPPLPVRRPSLADLLESHGLRASVIPEDAWLPDAEPRPLGAGRWEIALLEPDWCRAFAATLDALHRRCLQEGVVPGDAPNSMNRYGLVLDTHDPTGAAHEDALLDLATLRTRLAPTLARLFPEHHGATLDHHHGFAVRYAMDEDRSLGFHADDAEVTVNIGLDDAHEGGALWFEGARCALHRDTPAHEGERMTWTHRPGVALLHAGADRHGAHPITRGTRHNLVMWMRSATARREGGPRPWGLEAECPDWCSRARVRGVS